jgi:hypothetical protein
VHHFTFFREPTLNTDPSRVLGHTGIEAMELLLHILHILPALIVAGALLVVAGTLVED